MIAVPTTRWYDVFCNCCGNLVGTFEDGLRARDAMRIARATGLDVCLFASTASGEFAVEEAA